MLPKLLLASCVFCLATSALAEIHSNKDGSFSFTTADGWKVFDENDSFSLVSPDGYALLKELVLEQQSSSETLEQANERVTAFHHGTMGGKSGESHPVSGTGWVGILQRQKTSSGGYEFQLVAKTDSKILVFYLALPIPGSESQVDLRHLESTLLSLTIPPATGV